MMGGSGRGSGTARVIDALTGAWPRRRLLVPAALITASWSACAGGDGPLVAFLGDSLTSGWRLREAEAYPALVARALRERGRPVRVVNAGVSGDTVAQGLARLPAVLRRKPAVLVVALGINDGLRGLPLGETEAGLRRIVSEAEAGGACILLVGMRLPPGTDPERARRFDDIYPRLAAELRVALVPDLLDGVTGDARLVFPDGLHPTAAGHVRLAGNVRPQVELLLAQVDPGRR
jgi:acyl-CoA thioesterase-1